MANRVIFVSSKCEHCEQLLTGIQQYDILQKNFTIVNIDTEPFPNYIKSVPSLLMNGQIIIGEDLFEYMGRIVESTMNEGQQQQQQQQQQQETPPKNQQQQQQKPPNNQQCSPEDEMLGFCSSGSGVEYSMISDSNDDYTKSFHQIDTNLEFLEGQGDMINGNHSQVQLSKDDTFDSSDKRKEFDSDYERLMNARKL